MLGTRSRFSLLIVFLVFATVSTDAIAATPPTPTNTTPGSTSAPGPVQGSTSVTMSWSASSGATYYQFGVRDMVSNTLVVDTTTTNTSYTAALSAGGQYRWNVAACNSSNACSSYTTPLYFQTPAAVTIKWASLPPASISAGQSFVVSWTYSGTGGATPQADVRWDLANPESGVASNCSISTVSCYSIASSGLSTTVTAPSKTASGTPLASPTNVFYVIHATVNGSDYYSPRASTTVTPNSSSYLPAPALSSPTSGALDQPVTPTFSWAPVPGATSYRIMVAEASNVLPSDPAAESCTGCAVNTVTGTTSFQPSVLLSSKTPYSWEVKAIGSSGPGLWSERRAFTTAGDYLPAPNALSPADGAVNQPAIPRFSWSAVTADSTYRIMVATTATTLPTDPSSETCAGCLINDTTTNASYTPSAGLPSGATLYWQVRARTNSAIGRWTRVFSFSTTTCGASCNLQNPTPADIATEILADASKYGIPPIVVAAVLSHENTAWHQFDSSGDPVTGPTGDIGLMQINVKAPVMTFDLDRVRNDWKYNLGIGCQILRLKFQQYAVDTASPYDNVLDTQSDVIENWYYPIAWYNGSGTQAYDYVTAVLANIRTLPSPGSSYLHSLPAAADPQGLPGFPTTIYPKVPTPSLALATATPNDLLSHGMFTLSILKDRGDHIHRQNLTTFEFIDITAQVLTISPVVTLTAQLGVDLSTTTAPTSVRLRAYASGASGGETATYTFYCDRGDVRTDISPGYAYRSQPTTAGQMDYSGCTYSVAGTYSPKVVIESNSQAAQATFQIVIKSPVVNIPDFYLPLEGGKSWALTTEYGTPSHPECLSGIGGLSSDRTIDCFHTGHARYSLDFAPRTPEQVVESVNVIAAADGVVSSRSGFSSFNGYFVVIDHPNSSDSNRFSTYYLHLADGSVRVSPGMTVHRGDVLGLMGNTGQSFGRHLHFEITYQDQGDPTSSNVLDMVRIEGLRFADFHVGFAPNYAFYPSTNSVSTITKTAILTTQPAGVAPLADVGLVARVPGLIQGTNISANGASSATVAIYCDGSNPTQLPDAVLESPPALLEFRPCQYRQPGVYRPMLVLRRPDGSTDVATTTITVVPTPDASGKHRAARH